MLYSVVYKPEQVQPVNKKQVFDSICIAIAITDNTGCISTENIIVLKRLA